MKNFRTFLGIALGLIGLDAAYAQQIENRAPLTSQTWLHLDGYTVHFNAPDAASDLAGVGFSFVTPRFERLRTAWEGDVFRDSARKTSGYLGYSWSIPLGAFHAGVTGAVMYHRNFLKQNSLGVLPVGLPFIEGGSQAVRVRAYYIPPIRSKHDHQIALQLMMRL